MFTLLLLGVSMPMMTLDDRSELDKLEQSPCRARRIGQDLAAAAGKVHTGSQRMASSTGNSLERGAMHESTSCVDMEVELWHCFNRHAVFMCSLWVLIGLYP